MNPLAVETFVIFTVLLITDFVELTLESLRTPSSMITLEYKKINPSSKLDLQWFRMKNRAEGPALQRFNSLNSKINCSFEKLFE